jgi:hypothetical protein
MRQFRKINLLYNYLYFLVSRIADDGQSPKTSNSEYCTPSLEFFRIYMEFGFHLSSNFFEKLVTEIKVYSGSRKLHSTWAQKRMFHIRCQLSLIISLLTKISITRKPSVKVSHFEFERIKTFLQFMRQ